MSGFLETAAGPSSPGPKVVVVADGKLLAETVAARTITAVLDAQAARGVAHVVLTGGTIGIASLAALATAPGRDAVDWGNVHLWWGDERFVASGDPDRNDTQAREALLGQLTLDPAKVHVMAPSDGEFDDDVDAAAADYARELADAADVDAWAPAFDVLMLGVGPDRRSQRLLAIAGDTASSLPASTRRKSFPSPWYLWNARPAIAPSVTVSRCPGRAEKTADSIPIALICQNVPMTRLARPLVLSGFMATGKTTLGRRLAERLGVPFVDTDELVATAGGATTGQLFARDGEARFRDLECSVILPLLEQGGARVIAFGGGAVTVPQIRHAALQRSTLVTLTASPETIVARAGPLADRPNLGAHSPVARARDLLLLRAEAYGECHLALATDELAPDELVSRLAELATREPLAMPLGTRSYAIDLVDDEPEALARELARLEPSSVVVVTDANVAGLRGAWLDRALAAVAVPRLDVVLTPGEEHKTVAAVQRVWDAALGASVDRDALVLAYGGGVVGDLAGFAASTLLRGVRCVQIATTLLSMVDSSVGGKTGFDHAAGKNLVGAFFQPSHVVLDIAHLETLDPRQRAAGLAEVVKIALVRDRALLELVEHEADAIAAGERSVLRRVVRAAVQAKIDVVRDDEREAGPRGLLNLGHTVGHALESHGGYAALLHGEGVAIGTVLEIAACERMGLSPRGAAERARTLLARLALPVSAERATVEAAWPFVLSDKKRSGTHVKLPVVRAPGMGEMTRVSLEDLRRALLA